METAQRIGEGLTFEKVWAAIQATNEQMRETDRQLKERMKETDRIVRENVREMKESSKRLDKQLGGIHNRFGEIVECMVAPNLKEKFSEIGLSFQETSRNKEIVDKDGKFLFEVDVVLENGDKAMLVETKTKPTTEDVNDHVERLKKMRSWADIKGDKRKFFGAIAGAVMTEQVKDYALKNGFYVIEPSGDTFNITEPTGSYYPHEW